MDDKLLRMIAAIDQDEAECLRWWRESSDDELHLMWDVIQRHYDEPLTELMSRFAQLGFSQVAAKVFAERRSL